MVSARASERLEVRRAGRDTRLTGRNIDVDALATQLVIGRCVTHPRHRRAAPTGTASTSCGQLIGPVHRWCRGCGNPVDESRTTRNSTHRPVTLRSSETHKRHHTLTSCRFATVQPTDPHQPGGIVHQGLVVTAVTDTVRLHGAEVTGQPDHQPAERPSASPHGLPSSDR